jgi:lipid II:glycine glycyltransferase (peptidoglycan interpeptide bridge formation enzyme)
LKQGNFNTSDSLKMTEIYNIRVSQQADDPEWDSFLANCPSGQHVQTSLWSQVKSTLGYRPLRLVGHKQGRIVAGGQILVRQLFPFAAIAYMTKGPVFLQDDLPLKEVFLNKLKEVVGPYHIRLLAVQPATESKEFASLLARNGFQPGWLELAPTATILLDLNPQLEQILAKMKRQTRQNIRRSEREGITIREGTQSDLPAFYRLHLATSQRQKFTPYSERYFTCMWQILAPHGYIHMIIAEFGGEPVSALLLVPFGDAVVAKILGWSGRHAERRPNDAVFWASIQWAKTHGYRCFDFEGIDRRGAEIMVNGQPLPEELQHTPDFFKLGYGGQVALLPKSFDLITNPLLRWPYRKVFGKTDRGIAANKLIDRIRRRFG